MPDIKLVAETGREQGSSSARRLRHLGKIPGVVYGHGIEATPVAVEARALRTALSTSAGLNVVVELEVAGSHHLAMAKDVQRHPVRGTVSHVDFLVVNRNEAVTVDVPVNLVGEALEIKVAGGLVAHELFTLTVHTTPANIPDSIEVDVSPLTIGAAIRVGDLTLPRGATTDVDPETVVVLGQPPQAVELPEEVAGESAEGAEGEAAEAAAEGGEGSGAEPASEG